MKYKMAFKRPNWDDFEMLCGWDNTWENSTHNNWEKKDQEEDPQPDGWIKLEIIQKWEAKIGGKKYRKTGSVRTEKVRDFSLLFNLHLWKRLKEDNEDDNTSTCDLTVTYN